MIVKPIPTILKRDARTLIMNDKTEENGKIRELSREDYKYMRQEIRRLSKVPYKSPTLLQRVHEWCVDNNVYYGLLMSAIVEICFLIMILG